ncbi:MAG TPA: hypothetical protein VKZ53_26495 [Candidatus Angelobacter sp.]|nr:hypothetical protein [Candidatus Angelobacter sp.]
MNASAALWVSILLGACAQVFLKKGVSPRGAVEGPVSYLSLLRSGWVWAWAVCFFFATGLWLVAISSIQLSYAFPLLSVGYPIVGVLSILMLKERVPATRWIAIAVITLGVALIFRTA